MKNHLFAILSIVSISMASQAVAQEEETESTPLTISGSLDTYFRGSTLKQAPGTSFANLQGFSMGMVNLIGTYEKGKTGAVLDLVYGPRGVEAAFGTNLTGQSIVNQMYAYYNVSDKVTLTIGQWNTYLGYEVISPVGNVNYSTSYMFSWGPFSQAGIKADIALSDKIGLTLAFMNPTDVLETNFVPGSPENYTAGVQISYTTDAAGVYLNTRYGDASGKLFQVDLTGGYDFSDAVYLGFNATTLDDDGSGFSGVALYPKLTLSDAFAVGLRGEYFMMKSGYLVAADSSSPVAYDADGDGNVMAFTLSGNYSVGNLTLIPEFRMDMQSEEWYLDKDGGPTKSLNSFLLAAVYSF